MAAGTTDCGADGVCVCCLTPGIAACLLCLCSLICAKLLAAPPLGPPAAGLRRLVETSFMNSLGGFEGAAWLSDASGAGVGVVGFGAEGGGGGGLASAARRRSVLLGAAVVAGVGVAVRFAAGEGVLVIAEDGSLSSSFCTSGPPPSLIALTKSVKGGPGARVELLSAWPTGNARLTLPRLLKLVASSYPRQPSPVE